MRMSPSARDVRSILLLASLTAVTAACASRSATIESEPAPLTQADYYGTYDLYMGGAPEDQPAFRGVWTASAFVVYQGDTPTITVGMAIDPSKHELQMWDDETDDVRCGLEGTYSYTDDGKTITLTLVDDACSNRAQQADGARLVRRDSP